MTIRLPLLSSSAVLLVAVACGRSSCVDFDGQSVVARHDSAHDRMDVLLVYRDLHSTEADMDGAIEQLGRIRDGERWFAFGSNFPFMLDVDKLAKQSFKDSTTAQLELRDVVVQHTTVRSGPLWLDGQGRLCGSQLVRLDSFTATLAATNAAIRDALSTEAGLAGFAKSLSIDDSDSLQLLRAAVDHGHVFVALRGSAPCFALPVSDAGFVAMKRAAADTFWKFACESCDKPPAEEARRRTGYDFLALNEWSIEHTPGLVTFVLGDPRVEAIELTVPSTGFARPGLAAELTKRGWSIAAADGDAAARARFDAFVRED